MTSPTPVTSATFREQVIDAPGIVLVDFWAQWCGPCAKLKPILHEVAEQAPSDVRIVTVDVDQERTLAAMFQVMSIPTVLIYKDGTKVDEFQGVRSAADIVAKITALT
ncbi:thioredoxin [Corynebacterium uberis]|uniref:thioredoxin n=1 Tax=Corynebacterium TaxID=1716 RepID=UPI001D0A8953|nr:MULTISPECIES: thioredoxin [Corynebacterium]MCZ9310161.1 thioredoxin [Corynebacterium sp. c6VSa_13]UDL73301.1 thioredoxin [Corynebacterium uberis]UDL75821.1 thioredoxin [Corynebacterium uberis]UDL78034.1 thioredoxin [Corynebacterium uberis]UDL80316.1 thioredoxin [Corynebacterium uberis]